MLNAEGSAGVSSASRAQYMRAGSFFGAIQGKREQCGAIFTDLRHAAPRKLPMHSHELAFFALLLDGLYAERYGRRQCRLGECPEPRSNPRGIFATWGGSRFRKGERHGARFRPDGECPRGGT